MSTFRIFLRYFSFLLPLLVAIEVISCSSDHSFHLNKLLETDRATLQTLDSAETTHLRTQLDSIEKLPVINDTLAMQLTIDIADYMFINKHYGEIIKFIHEVEPLIDKNLQEGRFKAQSTIVLDYYLNRTYVKLQMLDRATEGYLRSLKIAKTYKLHDWSASIYNNIGYIYNEQKRYDEALDILNESVKMGKRLKKTQYVSYNYENIADIYHAKGFINKAIEYRFMALHDMKDSSDRMVVMSSLAKDYAEMKEYSLAHKQLLPVIHYYEKSNHVFNLPVAYGQDAYYQWKMGYTAIAKSLYEKAFRLIDKCDYAERLEIVSSFAEFCDSLGDQSKELSLLKFRQQIADEIENNSDKRATVSRLYEEELAKNDASVQHYEGVIGSYRWWVVGMLLMMALMALGFVFYIKKLNQRNAKNLNNLNNMQEQLTVATMEAQRTQSFISQLLADLLELQKHTSASTQKDAQQKIRKITSQVMRAENGQVAADSWAIANPAFYNLLLSKWPKLTLGDLRLCAMLRQGLSSKEIADLTSKEVHSIEVARNRLRTKMGIAKGTDMMTFLNQLSK